MKREKILRKLHDSQYEGLILRYSAIYFVLCGVLVGLLLTALYAMWSPSWSLLPFLILVFAGLSGCVLMASTLAVRRARMEMCSRDRAGPRYRPPHTHL